MIIRYLIMNAYAPGGTVRTTFTMASELAARHHDVEIVSVYRRREDAHFPLDPRVRLRALVDLSPSARRREERRVGRVAQARRGVRQWASAQPSQVIHPAERRHRNFDLVTDAALLRFLRSVRGGILVGTRPGLNLAVARFGRRSAVRVGQEHLNLGRHPGALRASIQRYYPRLDVVTSLTTGDAADYVELLGDEVPVVTIPNAVPDVGGARASLDSRVVIAAGRLTRQKGFDRLVPAFAKVVAEHDDWQLRIFGSDERGNRERFQRQIDALGVGANIKLMGFTHALHQEMAASSVYVMSSRFEGFPMVLLEAMGCGLPPVSFDCPSGPRDVIDDGVDGFVVPNGDVDALAARLSTLVEDAELRRSMGAAAVAKARRYDRTEIAERWETLFAQVAAAKGVRV